MNDFILIFILLLIYLLDINPNKMSLLQDHEPVWFPWNSLKVLDSQGWKLAVDVRVWGKRDFLLNRHKVQFCEIETFWRLCHDVKMLNMVKLHIETW